MRIIVAARTGFIIVIVAARNNLDIAVCVGGIIQEVIPISVQGFIGFRGVQHRSGIPAVAGAQTQGVEFGRGAIVTCHLALDPGRGQLRQEGSLVGSAVFRAVAVSTFRGSNIIIAVRCQSRLAVGHQDHNRGALRTRLDIAFGNDRIRDFGEFSPRLIQTVLDIGTAGNSLLSGNTLIVAVLNTGAHRHRIAADPQVSRDGFCGLLIVLRHSDRGSGSRSIMIQRQDHSCRTGFGILVCAGIAGIQDHAHPVVIILAQQAANSLVRGSYHGCRRIALHGAGHVQHQHHIHRRAGVAHYLLVCGEGRQGDEEVICRIIHRNQVAEGSCIGEDGLVRPHAAGKFRTWILRIKVILPLIHRIGIHHTGIRGAAVCGICQSIGRQQSKDQHKAEQNRHKLLEGAVPFHKKLPPWDISSESVLDGTVKIGRWSIRHRLRFRPGGPSGSGIPEFMYEISNWGIAAPSFPKVNLPLGITSPC